jgi:hypothetical protein
MRRKKCTFPAEPEQKREPLFSKADQTKLARLVDVYGREIVAKAAMLVPMPRQGRPPIRERGLEPFHEALALLSCIDDWTEEAREAGSKHPVEDALNAASEVSGLRPKTMTNKVSAAVELAAQVIDAWIDETLQNGRTHPLANAESHKTKRDKIRAYQRLLTRVPD